MSDDENLEPIETYEPAKEKPLWQRWLLPGLLGLILVLSWIGVIDLSPDDQAQIEDMIQVKTGPLFGELEAQVLDLRRIITGSAAPTAEGELAQPLGLLDIQNLNLELGNRDSQIEGLREQVRLYEAQAREYLRAIAEGRQALEIMTNTCAVTMENTNAEVTATRDDLAARADRALGVLAPAGDP